LLSVLATSASRSRRKARRQPLIKLVAYFTLRWLRSGVDSVWSVVDVRVPTGAPRKISPLGGSSAVHETRQARQRETVDVFRPELTPHSLYASASGGGGRWPAGAAIPAQPASAESRTALTPGRGAASTSSRATSAAIAHGRQQAGSALQLPPQRLQVLMGTEAGGLVRNEGIGSGHR
jgi:hypothetical protein